MKNCVGIAELLCAYADGELAESNIQTVEDHLEICENCSAILKVYKEISSSVDETNAPAPEALCIGVMNRIESEKFVRASEIKKPRSRYQIILTRFAPVAACLVVGLLVWQFRGPIRDMMPASSPGGGATEAMPFAAAPEVIFAEDSIAVNADSPMENESGDINDSGEDDPNQQAATDTPGSQPRRDILRDGAEIDDFTLYISNAYAEISITGDLPEMLIGYEPHPFGSWHGWEMVFEIPVSEVPALLDEVENRDGVEVAQNTDNENSTYAVVFYSSPN